MHTLPQTKKIIVGLSGGVDSSVTAALLVESGHEVEGVFMKNWEEEDTENYCAAQQDAEDAAKVCQQLGIPFHRINFAAEYWDHVFEDFLSEYRAGRTPNPDILCNREIKFKAFFDYAKRLGADFIATGHYARIQKITDQVNLLKGNDPNKDQSYFLYTLGQHQLAQTLFPIGELTKPEVRKKAAQLGLENHAKKDSTGICFIGERRFKDFLSRYLPAKTGEIVDLNGRTVGQHDGIMFYTLGQRQGLHIGGQQDGSGEPWYVVDKDILANRLIVVQGAQHPAHFKGQLKASHLTWVSGHIPAKSFKCYAKIRYRQVEQFCQVNQLENGEVMVFFVEPQRAVTPGQSIVFYGDNICLGGGIIEIGM